MTAKVTFQRVIKTTVQHISRNVWLSTASIVVVTLTFLLSSIFIFLALASNNLLTTMEQKAQVIAFFLPDTPDKEIFKVRDRLEATEKTESVTYISRDEALENFRRDFPDDPELLESITASALPPSLEVRAKSLDDLPEMVEILDEEKEQKGYIDTILYFKDVVDTLRAALKYVRVGGLTLVTFLAVISFLLVVITIGFNIHAHSKEIEIMKLLGASPGYIRMPFLLEGAFYGFIGSLLATLTLFAIWFTGIYLIKGSDFYFLISRSLNEMALSSFSTFNPVLIGIILLIEVGSGVIIGIVSSIIAVWRYLR